MRTPLVVYLLLLCGSLVSLHTLVSCSAEDLSLPTPLSPFSRSSSAAPSRRGQDFGKRVEVPADKLRAFCSAVRLLQKVSYSFPLFFFFAFFHTAYRYGRPPVCHFFVLMFWRYSATFSFLLLTTTLHDSLGCIERSRENMRSYWCQSFQGDGLDVAFRPVRGKCKKT